MSRAVRTPVDQYHEAAHKAAEEQAASTGGYALGPESPSRLVYGPGGVIALGCSRAQGPSLERLVRLANAAIAAGLEGRS